MTNIQDASIYRTGDLVIGSTDPSKSVYSDTGAKLIDNGVVIYGATDALNSQYKDLVRSATMSGGKPLVVSGGKKQQTKNKLKNKKTKAPNQSLELSQNFSWHEPEIEPPVIPAVKMKTVQFENDFGKIKAKVEHVVEHAQAYMLVFSDEDAVVFEPKVGEILIFHTESFAEQVYYPGVTFNSPDSNKKFMILFKVPEENQE